MVGLKRSVRIAAGMLGERNLVRKEYNKRSDTISSVSQISNNASY